MEEAVKIEDPDRWERFLLRRRQEEDAREKEEHPAEPEARNYDDEQRSYNTGQILFVTGCQSLANIANGTMVYTGTDKEAIKNLKEITPTCSLRYTTAAGPPERPPERQTTTMYVGEKGVKIKSQITMPTCAWMQVGHGDGNDPMPGLMTNHAA